ncbi:MAG: RNA polymerase sigma factor [Planctomycetota bacterium]
MGEERDRGRASGSGEAGRSEDRDLFSQHSQIPEFRGGDDSFDGTSKYIFDRAGEMSVNELWEKLTERYQRRLVLFADLQIGPSLRGYTTAEDVVQEVFLKVLRFTGTFEWRGRGSFFRWLCKKVREHVIDTRRKMDTRKGADAGYDGPSDESGHSPISRMSDDHAGPVTEVGGRDYVSRVRDTLERPELGTLYREVLVLLVVEGRESREVAEERGVSVDVLRRQKNRAKKIWRDLLEAEGLEPDELL